MYFPNHKIGCSSKFTSHWRGPFKIHKIMSAVLYEVDSFGRNGRLEIVHCDRIRIRPSQDFSYEPLSLSGTTIDAELSPSIAVSAKQMFNDEAVVSAEVFANTRRGREIKRPVKFKDFQM